MKHFYKFLLAALFFAGNTFAQSNFKPGYVISMSGDTLRGTIDYKEWSNTPLTIRMKDDAGKTAEYAPGAIKGFGVTGIDYYRTFNTSVSMDETEVSRVKSAYDSTRATTTAYFRLLSTGNNISLYSYTDEIKTRFFVTPKNGSELHELSYHVYLNSGTASLVTVNRFRIELAGYAADYEVGTIEFNKIIQRANYTSPDLIKIINLMNGESAKTTVATSGKGGTRFFIGAAIIGSQLKYSGTSDLAFNSQNHVNYYPQLAFGVDFFQNISTRKLVLRAEADVYSAEIKSISANAVKTVQTLTFTIQPQIRYNIYNTEACKFFLGTGFMVHFSSYSKNTYEVTNAVYTSSNKTSELSSTWYAIPVKAGFTLLNKIELYGAYHFGTMVEDNAFAGYRASMDAFAFGLNYTFGKR